LTSKDHATDCTINVRQVTEKGKRCCQFTQTASGRLFGSPRKRCANISGTLYASLDPERALHEPRNVQRRMRTAHPAAACCARHNDKAAGRRYDMTNR
jgi:hypothetical protein